MFCYCFKSKNTKSTTCQTLQNNRRLSIFPENIERRSSSSTDPLTAVTIEKNKIKDAIVKNLDLSTASNISLSYISQQIEAQYSLNNIKNELSEITKKLKEISKLRQKREAELKESKQLVALYKDNNGNNTPQYGLNFAKLRFRLILLKDDIKMITDQENNLQKQQLDLKNELLLAEELLTLAKNQLKHSSDHEANQHEQYKYG